jgi:hypothetical protein
VNESHDNKQKIMKTTFAFLLAALALTGNALAFNAPSARLSTPAAPNAPKAVAFAPATAHGANCATMVVAKAPLLKGDGLHRDLNCSDPLVSKTAECKRNCEKR